MLEYDLNSQVTDTQYFEKYARHRADPYLQIEAKSASARPRKKKLSEAGVIDVPDSGKIFMIFLLNFIISYLQRKMENQLKNASNSKIQ
jgi:hypothetical protein